ncbi:MAG: hypothetical protein ACFHWX_05845 [Bacteroidota bacterium]
MPNIEIASINAKQINIDQDSFELTVRTDQGLEYDRWLFYEFLSKEDGIMIHIGNPEFKTADHDSVFGGMLIDWDYEPTDIAIPDFEDPNDGANQQFRFQFLPEFRDQIDRLLNIALTNSPVSKIYFLTDYQFGPDEANYERTFLISDFWEQHDSSGLTWNTLYELYGK